MNIQQRNEAFYKNKPRLGTKEHCECEDCLYFAAHVDEHTDLTGLLATYGLHPTQADEVWCYSDEDDYKHYTVDFFSIYANEEANYALPHATVSVNKAYFPKADEPPYGMSINVRLKVSYENNSSK